MGAVNQANLNRIPTPIRKQFFRLSTCDSISVMQRTVRRCSHKCEKALTSDSYARKPPVRDQACFHFQQSAEKYVKARIERSGIRVPRTHQIDQLIRVLLGIEPLWVALVPAARRISGFAVRSVILATRRRRRR